MTIDPVCNMKVSEAAALQLTYQGSAYYFCSPVCKALFEREPEKYIRRETDETKKDEG